MLSYMETVSGVVLGVVLQSIIQQAVTFLAEILALLAVP